nr:DUF29 domain-containing protein [uncultured Rhodopila sp.]
MDLIRTTIGRPIGTVGIRVPLRRAVANLGHDRLNRRSVGLRGRGVRRCQNPLERSFGSVHNRNMPDDLYDRDVLAWSEHQVKLLRRAARGERVNDIDWTHVVEEIEDVGLSELNAVHSLLRQILVHLLKLHGWPGLSACRHWRSEIVAFQSDAQRRYAPSMRQRIDVEALYARALLQIEPLRYGGGPPRQAPGTCPVSLDDLLTAACRDLEAAFPAACTPS